MNIAVKPVAWQVITCFRNDRKIENRDSCWDSTRLFADKLYGDGSHKLTAAFFICIQVDV